MGAVSSIRVYNSTWQLIGFRHVISGSLALASLNHTCRNLVPTFPQRSPPSLLTTAACGGLRSTPDCRPRRAFLHLSYSYAPPCGPALLVTQCHNRTHAVQQRQRLRPGRGRDARYPAPTPHNRTCGLPACGSHLGSKRLTFAACGPALVTREPGAESSACFPSPHSPWSTPFAPPTPLRLSPPRTAPQRGATLFAGFTATMAGSDFSCPCIIGYGSSPSRCGPSLSHNSDGRTRNIPGSDTILLHVMWPSTPAGRQHLA